MELGGNLFLHWLGTILKSRGEKLINKGKPYVISNPNAKLANPFTLIINFTVNNIDKYQVVIQGRYANKYKESATGELDIPEKEINQIIASTRDRWFKKEL